MNPCVIRSHTVETQKVEYFTGEGAYHGSVLKPRPVAPPTKPPVREATPTTVERYEREGRTVVEEFDAEFPNAYRLMAQLPVPTQEQIPTDGVEFCWVTLEEALAIAGPVTRGVLLTMCRNITGRKRHVYVDSKIQYFEPGDLPVDSKLWHVDGVTAVRDPERTGRFGWRIVQDLRARFDGEEPPLYQAYQSSHHCATEFIDRPLQVRIPELMPRFDGLDFAVRAADPRVVVQPAGSIVAFNGLSLHRAVPATAPGWRLWVRLTETDREIVVDPAMLDCYGTVFRTPPNLKG